jgi:hypothetical protein
MAATAPAIQAQILESPDNWELINQLFGLPELVLIEAEARNKLVWEIEQLLQQSPIPPDPAEMMATAQPHAAATIAGHAGMGQMPPPLPPPPYRSSIEPQEADYHVYEAKKCQEWLSSNERRRQDAMGNTAGVENVKLHWKEHMMMVAAMAPPPPPAPVVAPHPGGGPPKPPGAGGPPKQAGPPPPPNAPAL